MIMDKKLLRKQYRDLRKTIEADVRADWDKAIFDILVDLPQVSGARCPFVYLSNLYEVNTRPLVAWLCEQTKMVLCPSPDKMALPHDGLHSACVLDAQVDSGGLEPEASIEDIDVIIVPGIAWDRQGYRVGYGGGYFDRLLAIARPDCVKVGLAYGIQVVDGAVPREPWDERVDLLVSETGAWRTAEHLEM